MSSEQEDVLLPGRELSLLENITVLTLLMLSAIAFLSAAFYNPESRYKQKHAKQIELEAKL